MDHKLPKLLINFIKNKKIKILIFKISKILSLNFKIYIKDVEKIVSISQGMNYYHYFLRFYMRLGFIPIKYLNKRKALKLAKPVVLPGFPKVT